jgi:phage tail sheath protein FI
MSYLSPGVYVEEKSSGIKPIEGVGTATGAFVGITEKGPIGEAVQITNRTQFENIFGGMIPIGILAYSVNQFFQEGGTRCFVVRTCHYDDVTKLKSSVPAAITLNDSDNAGSMRVLALWDGIWGNSISVDVLEVKDFPAEFKIVVNYKGVEKESYDKLTLDTVESSINSISTYIKVEKDGWNEGPTPVTGSGKIPVKTTVSAVLASGNDGLTAITYEDFIGTESALTGLHAFDLIDDINIVAMPDMAGDRNAILGALAYCMGRADCFFLADPPKGRSPLEVLAFKNATGTYAGQNSLNSTYGALYYPWLLVGKKLVPPSGAVAGTYAYTDTARGVHKAPAGTPDGYLDSVSGIERIITRGEHNGLNPEGINVIRTFPRTGICVWGARTLTTDPEWKYINIRRLFLYLEKSIEKATQWVVFEPNSPALWGSVNRNITAFLLLVWKNGALFGNTPEEAFYVKVDAENNPEEVRNVGQLIIEVGVAPVRPAEFVIIRIKQKTAGK